MREAMLTKLAAGPRIPVSGSAGGCTRLLPRLARARVRASADCSRGGFGGRRALSVALPAIAQPGLGTAGLCGIDIAVGASDLDATGTDR
jgi:hypothetical protein